MPSHQNHHYVPAFLLREWQQADNKLTQFTWENNRFITSRRQAKSVAKEKHLYSTNRSTGNPDVGIEVDVMGPKVDDPAALVHQKLLAGGVGRLSNAEQETWAKFLLSLLFRGPKAIADLRYRGRLKLLEVIGDATEAGVSPYGRPDISLIEWAQLEDPDSFEDLGVQTLEPLINSEVLNPKLLAATWETLNRGRAAYDFLISDNPLILVGEGLGGKFLMTLPLSPEQAFVAYSAPEIGRTLDERTTTSFVKAANLDTVLKAKSCVYATSATQAPFVERYLGKSTTG
ncbi:DUF4238 domain-containing protein [Rhodoferax sp. TBRC 17660]|uniref:DUF4238 domain-containing protein n=1 Tax=Rhodoferax potami TaxID=3068338 RepID=A0ABU3KJK1_9BURK|nr:DUF4238 domain-containing protein [Rhodoferax sp. TBRC 17660]MDT7517961.1 DUF4238 domain-containing protein [Rhodoferax sp. TBRC 17660]